MSITHFILYSWVSLILSHYYVSPILRLRTLKISFQCYYDRCLIAANSLGLVFIPILVLVVLNCMIFRTINKATQRHNAISTHQRRDHSVAMMLILIGTFDHNLNSLEWLLCINIISRNTYDSLYTHVSTLISVIVFVICHSIRSIINAYEFLQFYRYGEIREWPGWVDALVHINHFALVVNSSINILIYS